MQQQWEYTSFDCFIDHESDWSIEDKIFTSRGTKKLNELGEQGWELVVAYPVSGDHGETKKTRYILKRPKL